MRAFVGSMAEMLCFPRQSRHGARLSPDEATAERLLAGRSAGPGATAGQQNLELVLRAAAGPATDRELAEEAAAVAAFIAVRASSTRTRTRKKAGRPFARRVPALAAGFTMAVVIALCGTAEAGALPAPLQRLAHTFGAPAPVRPPAGHPLPGHATPDLTATASHPAPAPGKSAAGSASTQSPGTATPSTATPGTASPSVTSTAGNGQGNGNGQGQGKGQGNGKGNGASHGAQPTPKPTGKG